MYGLNEKTINSILEVFKTFPQIEKVVLYGSRAKGNYKNGSDIDFVLKGETLSSEILHKIIDKLDELYMPYKVDISIYDHIDNQSLKEHIDRVGVVFYSA